MHVPNGLQGLYNGVRFPVDGPCISNIRRLDYGALPMIDAMHRNGILIDKPHMARVSELLSEQMTNAYADIVREVGAKHAVNPASPKAVAELLFHKLAIQNTADVRLTDSGSESTDEDQLKYFEDAHPVVPHIIAWRKAQKLKSTYADKIPRLLDERGRIHTTFAATRTATGRLASRNVNLQNIPARTEEGRMIRAGFVAREGWRLVARDLSQIEMRGAAHYSGEPSWVEGFQDPKFDVHNQNTVDMFGLNARQIETMGGYGGATFKLKYRLPAKTLGFGVLYCMGPKGLQAAWVKFGVGFKSIKFCERFIDRFYEARPYIKLWQEAQFRRARQFGMVWDLLGRVRLIPQNKSVLGWVQREGERQAANMPIQSLAQGILKLAMAELQDWVDDYNRGDERVRMVLQIHDELMAEVREDAVEDYVEAVTRIMEGACPMVVPIGSDGAVMERWEK